MLKVGFVFSGGMAKGAYQIGALKAITKFFENEEITAVSSASVGVLNAFAFATGQVNEGVSFWKDMMCGQKKMFITSVLRGDYLQNAIKNLASKNIKIEKKFFSTFLFADDKELKYIDFSNEPTCDYEKLLQASVALPMTNSAVEVNGKRLYDGAMIDNIPVKPFVDLDLDIIVLLFFEDGGIFFENEEFDSKIIKIAFTNDSVVRDSIYFEKEKIDAMIKRGFEITKEKLDYFFADGKDNIDAVKQKIRAENEENKDRKTRITGDFVVRKFNSFMKKFIKS